MLNSLSGNRVAKNAGWIIGSKIVKAILGFVITMLTARYLGPTNFGVINYAGSIVAFAIPFAELGFTAILVRELIEHKDEEGRVLGTAILLSLFSSIICIIGLYVFVYFANAGERETQIVCFVYSLMIIFQMMEMIGYWFQAHLLSKYSSLISLFAYFIVSGYKFYLLFTKKAVVWFALSNSLEFFIIAILLFIAYKKLGGAKLSFSLSIGKRMFKSSKYYILSSLMVTIFANTDKIMINQMLIDSDVGFYSAALACATVTSFVFSAIIDSFRPIIFSSFNDNDRTNYELHLKQLYSIVIYMSLLQSLVICLFSKWIVLILYGEAYTRSIDVLKVVVWYSTFSYLGSVRNIWLLSEKKQKYLWKIDLSGALVNVFLNLLLIPKIGIIGAALASVITQFFTNVIVGWVIKPIRYNNRLLLQSLNPKYIIDILK